MRNQFRFAKFALFVSLSLYGLGALRHAPSAQQPAPNQREELYRHNNRGVALMEQFKHEEAVKEFQQALNADAKFAAARINLALAYNFLNDSPKALTEARKAVELAPNSPHARYALAMALRAEKQYDEALAEFNRVLALDPRDPAANVQAGQLFAQKQQYEQAINAFQRALDNEPYNQTAAYNLAQAYLRSGKQDEGQKQLAVFQKLRASGYATSLGNVYGEKGRYAEGVLTTGAEPELVAQTAPNVRFVDATAALGLQASFANKPLSSVLNRKLSKAEFENEATKRELVNPFSVTIGLFDADNDGKLEVLAVGVDAAGKPFIKLFHNDGEKFSDVTDKSKLAVSGYVCGVVFGNFDNDAKNTQDVFLFGYNTLALWRNNGDGTFAEVTAQTGLPASYNAWALTAAFVDADHDGDLDIFVGNFANLTKWPGNSESAVFPDDFAGTPNRLFRNNGAVDGKVTFTDITEQTGLSGGALKTTAVVCTDYDNHRDIDFLVVNYGAPVQLFSNQRDGSFKEVASGVGLKFTGKSFGAAAGDLNKDDFTDFYLTGLDESGVRQGEGFPTLLLSDGKGGFKPGFTGPIQGRVPTGTVAQFTDYDNDGLLDLLAFGFNSMRVWRGPNFAQLTASQKLLDESLTLADNRAFASGDLDGDGSIDLLALKADGALAVLKSTNTSKNYVALNLTGRSSNRSAIGTKAEIRSGSLAQKLEVYASSPAPAPASLIFGLGYRTQVDALKLTWPAGIVQSELALKTSTTNAIEELDRKGTSCPLLYAWNGSEYSFVTDFLGGSAIGYRVGAGKNDWNYPDTDEYVLIKGEQLRERDGRYSLRLNNQLEEVIYFDAVKLLAVDHPATVDVYPNERLMPAPPYPSFKLFTTRNAQPPTSAVADNGQDILPLITKVDRQYLEDFAKLPFKGYAREHAITLDLGERAKQAKRVLLLLTAWIDYADSTSNLAAVQAGVKLVPPYLQVKNARGQWETALAQMGFPAGLPKTMTVELPGKLLCESTQIRIVTSMRIYWDQILVDTSDDRTAVHVTTLQPLQAELRWRGFPREYSPDGRLPMLYDYRVIEPFAPWKAHLGNYTRYGEVRELVLSVDDLYVITRNGDELQVDFEARRLPPLPHGWRRDFLLYADGFGKDMDINSARPETIGELPYHGMKSYPYAAGEAYPSDAKRQAYLRKYNTRTVSDQRAAYWRGTK
jgi:Flp pilus assembly protein TadD